MKGKDIFKLLVPGIFVSLILGFAISMIVGVNPNDPIPNYIGWGVSCLVPTLLNGVVVLKSAAKELERELSIGSALKQNLLYVVISLIVGLVIGAGIIEYALGVSTCDISRVTTAVSQAITGAVVSTLFGYNAVVCYAKKVKYTKRTAKKTTKK